jgi:hypothetical protein
MKELNAPSYLKKIYLSRAFQAIKPFRANALILFPMKEKKI